MNLAMNIVLTERRCTECNRWFACELSAVWKCGSCAQTVIAAYWCKITKLERTNAALRGALKRRRGK